MDKEIKTMSDHELLMELVQEKRRAERARRLRSCVLGGVAALLLVLCLLYVPRAVRAVRRYNDTMESLNRTVTQVQSFLDAANTLGMEKWQQTVEQLNERLAEVQSFLHIGGKQP